MSPKSQIISHLNERGLLLPTQLAKALEANDRAKFYLTLLQTAKSHCDHPEAEPISMSRERIHCGVEDDRFDEVVSQSTKLADDDYRIPLSAKIQTLTVEAIEEMIEPIRLAWDSDLGLDGDEPVSFSRRLDTLIKEAPPLDGDYVSGEHIGAMTHGTRREGDGFHILIMDLHKALNRLQARLAEESIQGARVYQLKPAHKGWVEAFMQGLNRTVPLKFDHPGLDTTAMSHGNRLVIQNDIGTTDAHVFVIHVEGQKASITYTDVHLIRLQFFQGLFNAFEIEWTDGGSRTAENLEEKNYFLIQGIYNAPDLNRLDHFLDFLGSRLVFLIDWNKARKALRPFVRKQSAIGLLKWAADNNYGHRAFLELGGEKLIFEAIEYASKACLPYGQPLDQLLGPDAATQYLKFVFQTTSEGLLGGRSELLIRDGVKTELLDYFQTANEGLFDLAAFHAELVFEIANVVRDSLLRAPHKKDTTFFQRAALQADRWETRADRLLIEAREQEARSPETQPLRQLIEEADNAADGLEEAAFLLTLIPSDRDGSFPYAPLQKLSGLLVQDAQEYVKCISSAAKVRRGGAKSEMEDFLRSVEGIGRLEHDTDDAYREVTAALVHGPEDSRIVFLYAEIARTLEMSADALNRSALILRRHILGEVMTKR